MGEKGCGSWQVLPFPLSPGVVPSGSRAPSFSGRVLSPKPTIFIGHDEGVLAFQDGGQVKLLQQLDWGCPPLTPTSHLGVPCVIGDKAGPEDQYTQSSP